MIDNAPLINPVLLNLDQKHFNVAHFASSKHFCKRNLHTDFIFYFQSENKEIKTEYILKSKR